MPSFFDPLGLFDKPDPVAPPTPRDYSKEGTDTLRAQLNLMPEIYAAEAQYRPKFAQLDADILKTTLPQTSALEQEYTTGQRTSDISDVETLGPRATAAFREANPQLAQIQDTLTDRAMEGGDSAINEELRRQALEELRLGGRLSSDEARTASQQARAAYTARGLARSDAGAFGEVLNLSRYANDRQDRRRNFAMGVDSQALQREQYGSNLLGTTGQFLSQTSSDPFQAILGRSATPQSLGGAGFSLESQPQIFNPYDPYAGSLYAGNQQGQLDANTATAANNAAAQSGKLQAAGTIVGGLLMIF